MTSISEKLRLIKRNISAIERDCRQILLVILVEYKQIHYVLLPLKSSEKYKFSDDFKREQKSIDWLAFTYYQKQTWQQSLLFINRKFK